MYFRHFVSGLGARDRLQANCQPSIGCYLLGVFACDDRVIPRDPAGGSQDLHVSGRFLFDLKFPLHFESRPMR
jgi:hypothetical protein